MERWYRMADTFGWVPKGSLKGPKGDTGAAGSGLGAAYVPWTATFTGLVHGNSEAQGSKLVPQVMA